MKLLTFTSKEKLDLKEGTILRFLGGDYRMDFQDHLNAWEIIGEPVKDIPKVEFVPQ